MLAINRTGLAYGGTGRAVRSGSAFFAGGERVAIEGGFEAIAPYLETCFDTRKG